MFTGGDYLLREETQEEFYKYKLKNNGRDSEFLRPSPCPRQGSPGRPRRSGSLKPLIPSLKSSRTS